MGEYGDLPTPSKSYTVTFNANGGNTPSPSSKTVSYIFSGWYTAETGGTKVESTTVMGTRGGMLYARWTASTYGNLASCSRGASSDYTYSFRGWYTASSGGTNITASTTANLTSNQTLYAQWNSTARFATITITYDSSISSVTVNGTRVSNGWRGAIRQGDVIVATGSKSKGWRHWHNSRDIGFGTSLRCTAPSTSSSGSLNFYSNNEYFYYVEHRDACWAWDFSI